MTVRLIVHEIGRGGHPDATTRTLHIDADAARVALYARFGHRHVQGYPNSGTIGSMTGSVFQASRVWYIDEA